MKQTTSHVGPLSASKGSEVREEKQRDRPRRRQQRGGQVLVALVDSDRSRFLPVCHDGVDAAPQSAYLKIICLRIDAATARQDSSSKPMVLFGCEAV